MANNAAVVPLYMPIEPYSTGRLQVSQEHNLYYEQAGNPFGLPVIILHGGPGSGGSPIYRQVFDPKSYRIIMFDQRGAGKSTPRGSTEANTTWDLVADIEKLRQHLEIERFHIVFGGSWGSTLALAYAESHPERVCSLILRGIFLCRQVELRWLYQEGASFVFPDEWEKFISAIPEEERGDMIAAYSKRLRNSNDPTTQLKCAREWTLWETHIIALDQMLMQSFRKLEDDNETLLTVAKIENHYFVNRGFFDSDDYLLRNVHKIRHIPCVIVQGRYDMVCPAKSAWELYKAYGPNAELIIVPDAGHAFREPGIVRALLQACEEMKDLQTT